MIRALTFLQEMALYEDRLSGMTYGELGIKYHVSACTARRYVTQIDPNQRRALEPCGTIAAYARHRAKGEPQDQKCIDAHTAYNKFYKERQKNGKRTAGRRGRNEGSAKRVPLHEGGQEVETDSPHRSRGDAGSSAA